MLSASRAVTQLACAFPARLQLCRGMSVDGLKGFKEGEKVIEDLYFNKEEEKLLGKLLKKVKTQTALADKHSAAGSQYAEELALKDIVAKYNISKEDIQKLLAWKNTHY